MIMLYRLDLIELGFAKMRQDRYCILYIQYPNHIYIICKYIFFLVHLLYTYLHIYIWPRPPRSGFVEVDRLSNQRGRCASHGQERELVISWQLVGFTRHWNKTKSFFKLTYWWVGCISIIRCLLFFESYEFNIFSASNRYSKLWKVFNSRNGDFWMRGEAPSASNFVLLPTTAAYY